MNAAGFSIEWCAAHCFDARLIQGSEAWIQPAVEAIATNPALRQLDSMILPAPTFTLPFLGRCIDMGIRIPQDLAVINIGIHSQCELFRPQISCIDNNMAAHLQIAFELLEQRVRGQEDAPRIYFCQPKLIARGSSLLKQPSGSRS